MEGTVWFSDEWRWKRKENTHTHREMREWDRARGKENEIVYFEWNENKFDN